MYAYDREFISLIIKNSSRTKDGFYWCPFIKKLIRKKGKIKDNNFYYNREIFMNKLYFSKQEIIGFLSKKKIELDIYNIIKKKKLFKYVIKGYSNKTLKYKINNLYSINELVDNFEFKYS